MSWHDISVLEPELEDAAEWSPEGDVEFETADDRQAQRRRLRRRALARIVSLVLRPLPGPALPPPEPPPIVSDDTRRRGAQGGRERMAELESVRAHYPEAQLMEHLGRLATRTSDEAEAEALIGALMPLAAQMTPRAEGALLRAAPQLVHGLSCAARVLRSHPATRPLVRRLPTVARRTAIELGRRLSRGRPASPEAAVRSLVRQAIKVLDQDAPERAAGDPAPLPNNGNHPEIHHWGGIDKVGTYMRRHKWSDIRAGYGQVSGIRDDTPLLATGQGRTTKDTNVPDVQGIDSSGRRVYVEVDAKEKSSRAHQDKLLKADLARKRAGDPGAGNARGVFVVHDGRTGRVTGVRHVDPQRKHDVTMDYGPKGIPLPLLLKRGVLSYPVPAQVLRTRPTGPTRRPRTARRAREAELLAI